MIHSSKKTRQKRRAEQKVIDSVRPIVAERDGYCRVAKDTMAGLVDRYVVLGIDCSGPSDWAHLGAFRRAKTRRMAPEIRHSTQHTAQMCRSHHSAYDARKFDIEELTEAGADGPLAYRLR